MDRPPENQLLIEELQTLKRRMQEMEQRIDEIIQLLARMHLTCL